MPRHKSNQDSLERRVIETPSLSRADYGIVNEAFDSVSSPSFFYVEDSNSWIDPRRNDHKRFTESWIELDRAYSCASSFESKRKCRTTCCCCCRITCAEVTRWLVYLLVAISVIGFAAIVSAILYMEIFHKFDYEWHPLKDTDVFSHRHSINETFVASATQVPQSAIQVTSSTLSTVTISPSEGRNALANGTSSPVESVTAMNTPISSARTTSPSPVTSVKVIDTQATASSSPPPPVISFNSSSTSDATANAAGNTQKHFNVTSVVPKVVTNTPVNAS